ncbi:hypothetical protein DFO70_10784 [Cytobacillus firmus]|uniref:RocC n=2 Tax=Cytobacillus TaxID=2675230 RepID=A0A366JUT8_CYTFI|nr:MULTISPECIES: DUF1850 domain-containing protein [Cytobacillus]RBP92155.1 hypothetical protein DFO70_10784 [Cytobacillus firmus]TDX42160.1 hypothetical protein DFO72_107326 [Cytobacillus oceanisediminis]
MKFNKPGNKKAVLALLVIITIAIMFFIPIKQAVVFEYQNKGKVIAYFPIKEDRTFKIKYTHSIHLTDVVESYTITEDGSIKLFELMYEDFAIGMPENASDGETFEQKDGKYYIKNMKRVFPSFDLRLGKVRANHRLILQGEEYVLADYIEPGTWVRIKAKKINLFEVLKGVNILGK